MAHLEYNGKSIDHVKYNFHNFSSRKIEYTLATALEAFALLVPESEAKIKVFNDKFLKLERNFNLKGFHIPYGTTEGGAQISSNTESIESFLKFKNHIIDLNERLKDIQTIIKQFEDKKSLTPAYLEGLKFRVGSYNGKLYVSKEKEEFLRDLTKDEFSSLSNRSYHLSLVNLVKLKLYSLADIVEMSKNKNPFTKILANEIYQSDQLLKMSEDAEIELPAVKIYFLAADMEKMVPRYQWIRVDGEGGGTRLSYVTNIDDATPMNRQRVEEVIRICSRVKCVCCEYDSEMNQTVFLKNNLSQRVDSVIEKKTIAENLTAPTIKSKTHKI